MKIGIDTLTPVVCSNRSSLPEIAGGAAFEANPELSEEIAAAIWRVLTEEDLRKSLVKKGFARASDFSWEKTAANSLSVLQRAGGTREKGAMC